MKKILTAALLCMALAVTMVPGAFAADTGSNYTQCMAAIQEQKTIQSQAHQTAESLRQQGYGESSSYIKAAQAVWWDSALKSWHFGNNGGAKIDARCLGWYPLPEV